MELSSLILSLLFSFTFASDPELRILPAGGTFVRALGMNIMLRCEVFGLGPQQADINLQWFDSNGAEITDTAGPNRVIYVEKEEDSPTKKLYLIHIQARHAGTYTCKGVIGGNEQVQSVSLVLFKDITFDSAPSPQHPTLGATALLLCRVSGQPAPTVSWRYRGERITNSARYAQDVNGLWVKNITKEDDGLYYCRAEVEADGRYDEREINVIVHIAPTITEKSISVFGIQSYEHSISCLATGLPDPKYVFTKDGYQNPLHNTDRRFIDVDSGVIHFRPLHKEDEGLYSCNASNNAGEDFGEIRLAVIVPPTIYDLKNVTQTENLTTTVVCKSYGDPAPSMTFQKAGNAFNYSMGENENGRIMMSNPYTGELELIVRDLVPDDMANYTCKSTNTGGYHERNGTITVQFKPRFAADHIQRIYSWPGKLRNMTCFSLAEPMPSIEWIRYDYSLFDNETFRIYNMGKNSNLQVRVREVDQGWIYGNYTCRVRNHIGQTDLKIDLLRAMAPGPPKSVIPVLVTSDLVELKVELPVDNGGVEVIGYRVEYEERILTFALDDDVIVENLRPSTTFFIRVRALNEVGYGEPYSITVITDNVKAPSKLIINSSPMSIHPYAYEVTWKKPVTGGRPIREYRFRFRQYYEQNEEELVVAETKSEDWIERRTEDDEDQPMTYYILTNLLAQTTYELEVTARNDLGWSPPNDPFTFTTQPGANPDRSTGKGIRSRSATLLFVTTFVFVFVLTDRSLLL